MKTKASYYMVIPATVWGADIADKAKILYGHIATLANKQGYAHATNSYYAKQLGCTTKTVSNNLTILHKLGVIRSEITIKPGTQMIEKRKIYLQDGGIEENVSIEANYKGPIEEIYKGPIEENVTGNSTSNNTTSINNIDESKSKIFYKLVSVYPPNRVGNRKHGLEKFKQLDTADCKLAILNLQRYLSLAGQYVKSLQNYIDQGCYSEAWLTAEEETKRKRNNKTNNNHNFSGKY